MAFEKAKQKVETINALTELRDSLKKLGPIPNDMRIYDYAVHFFNIVVRFNDKYSVDKKMFKDNAESAGILATHLSRAGRQEYGWVRAKKGQEVTLDNLYLGNVHGLWTKTARTFKDMPNDKYVQDAIQGQLHGFISSHREPMIKLSDQVLGKKSNGLMSRLFGRGGKSE